MRQSAAALTVIATAVAIAGCGGHGSSSSSSYSTGRSRPAPGPAAAVGATMASRSVSAASTAGAAAAGTAGPPVTISVKRAGDLGPILAAGPRHLTVYLFETDTGGRSTCSGACARAWPPVLSGGPPVAGGGVSGSALRTIVRPDGTRQVTYHGHPLYFFAADKDDGDHYGEGVVGFGAGWYVLDPAGGKVDRS